MKISSFNHPLKKCFERDGSSYRRGYPEAVVQKTRKTSIIHMSIDIVIKTYYPPKMLALNLDPINSKPLKNPSVFPPKSSLKLKLSSSYSPFSSNSVKTHESYNTNLQIPFTKSKLPFILSKPTSHITQASSSSSSSSETLPTKTRKLTLIFTLWYLQNIVFNIYNKKCLNIFPFPWLLASFQLLVSSIWMFFLWSFKLQPCPKITKPFLISLLVTSIFHTIGHISACVLFAKIALFFTNVIRSSEPVVAVIFSSFLGQSYPFSIWVSILPIVFGCSLAAITEFSFNFHGLWGAVISNVGFVLRNIYSKKSLQRFKEVDGLNLYGCISIISFIYLFPAAVIVEGTHWVRGYHKAIATIGNCRKFYLWFSIAGVFYHLYNQTSYQALDEITPLTFSVGNAMIGVVVIVSTVLLFRNPVRPINVLGIGVAILGTYLYSKAIAAQMAKKKKIEGEKSC